MTGAPSIAPTEPAGHRPRRGRRLRDTLVALLVGTVAVVCLVVGIVTHASVSDQLHAQLDGQLMRAADRRMPPGGADGAGSGGGAEPSPSPGSGAAGVRGGPGGGEFELGAVVDRGRVHGAWRDSAGKVRQLSSADRSALAAAVAGAPPGRNLDVSLSIGSYRIRVADDRAPGSAAPVRVITGLPLAGLGSTLHRLDLTLAIAGLGAALVTGVAGALIVRRTMRPLEEVTTVAGRVADMPLAHGEVALSERVRPEVAQSGTEAGEVGRALNLLLANVGDALEVRQRTEETMRRFVADASHELRTPLTAIRGYTEMLRLTEELTERGEQSVDRMQAQSERMTALVEDLLLLARLDEAADGAANAAASGGPAAMPEVELGEIVVDAVMDARVSAPDHRWRLDVGEDELVVCGDPGQLAQVVANLLSNARKHTPEGTTVEVRLHPDPECAHAVLEVIDDGPGIDPAITGDVFARFTRADAVRSGSDGTTGLGLPIVKAIVQAHRGSIGLDSGPGRTAFIVTLPLAG